MNPHFSLAFVLALVALIDGLFASPFAAHSLIAKHS